MIAPKQQQVTNLGAALREPYRRARKSDAHALAELVNFAGEGLPVYLWDSMREKGQSVWDVGRERARREVGSFSYKNAVVRQDDTQVTAALIGYPLPDRADPAVYDDMPAMFMPLQELEDLALSTWYVNVLAAYPDFRGRGFGGDLLAIAEGLARDAGCRGLSIIVSDFNEGARRLYERNGYEERARRPMIKEGWENPGSEWVLLVRSL